jgi:AbrB family looped-hinge helix DNA binding protein
MSTLVVSSKGQIVLPASTRRRLGLGAGSTLELLEEGDSVRLRVVRSVPKTCVTELAGMVTAPSRGTPRRLDLMVRARGPRRPAVCEQQLIGQGRGITRAAAGLQEVRHAAERERIRQTLIQTDWNVSAAARLLDTERTALHKRIRALGLKRQ